jgi:hypothetical protein
MAHPSRRDGWYPLIVLGRLAERVKKPLAVAITAALLISTPGVGAYQAVAARIVAPVKVAPRAIVPNAVGSSLAPLRTSLNPLSSQLNSLNAVLPNIANAPQTVAHVAAPVAGYAAANGRIGQAMLQRAAQKDAAPQGLYNVVLRGVAGGEKAVASSAQAPYLKAPAAAASAGNSHTWAQKSFDVLRGASKGSSDVQAVAAGALKPLTPANLLPAAANLEETSAAVPQPAKRRRSGKGFTAALAGLATLMLAGTAQAAEDAPAADSGGMLAFLPDWASNLFSWETLSSPWYWVISLSIGVGFHFGKKWLKKRKKTKAKDRLAQGFAPEELAPEAGAEKLAKLKGKTVPVFDFASGRFEDLEVTDEMLEGVRAGGFSVSADSQGEVFVSPTINEGSTYRDISDEPLPEPAKDNFVIWNENDPNAPMNRPASETDAAAQDESVVEPAAVENAAAQDESAVEPAAVANEAAQDESAVEPVAVESDAAQDESAVEPAAVESEPEVEELDPVRASMVAALEQAPEGTQIGIYDFGQSQFRFAPLTPRMIEYVRRGALDVFAGEEGGAELMLAPTASREQGEEASAVRSQMVAALEGVLAENGPAQIGVYDFEIDDYRAAELNDKIIADVRDGLLNAFAGQDGQGVFLIPANVVEIKVADEAAAQQVAEPAEAEESAEGAPEAPAGATTTIAAPTRPQSTKGFYGAAVGGLLAYAVMTMTTFGAAAWALPLIAWAVFENIPDSSPSLQKVESYRTFWGLAAGVVGGLAAVTYGAPVTLALALPAVGVAVAYGVNNWLDSRKTIEVPTSADWDIPELLENTDAALEAEAAEQVAAEQVDGEQVTGRETAEEAALREQNDIASMISEGGPVVAESQGEAEAEVVAPAPRVEEATSGDVADAAPVVEADDSAAAEETGAAPTSEGLDVQEPVELDAPVAEAEAPSQPRAPPGNNPSGLAGASPASFKNLPVDAQDMTASSFLEEKQQAQERARAQAPDARLTSAHISLADGRAHWVFTFHSKRKRKIYTVWQKRIGVKSQKGTGIHKKPTLWNSRISSMRSMQDAYTALKKDAHWFTPVRVDVKPRWKKDPVLIFTDARGRTLQVTGSNQVEVPASFRKFHADVQGMTGATLMAQAARAQARVNKVAPDARLVRIAFDPKKERQRWVFTFHSPAFKQILTVRKSGISAGSDNQGSPLGLSGVAPGMGTLSAEMANGLPTLREAYAELKERHHWFVPVRVEVLEGEPGQAVYVFQDAKGRLERVGGAVTAPQDPIEEEPVEEPVDDAVEAPRDPVEPIEDGTEPIEDTPPAPPEQGKGDRSNPPDTPPGNEEEAPPDDARPPPSDGEDTGPPDENDQRASLPNQSSPHIHEGFFGFRRVQGITHDSNLSRLSTSASASEIAEHISRQFDIPLARVYEMAAMTGLDAASERSAWLSVHRRIQKSNRREFEQFDRKKYQGSLLGESISRFLVAVKLKKKTSDASFRKLANREYAPGGRGTFQRAIEIHKHVVGFFVRLPYHLFDMFFFGYFRRAIAFEFRHSKTDFITMAAIEQRAKMIEKGIPEAEAERIAPNIDGWVEQAFKAQAAGSSRFDRFAATPLGSLLDRFLWTPLVAPLWQFMTRRVILAVASAVAMGFIAGVVPLPILAFKLTALPILGPALLSIAHGLPMAVGSVPFVGEAAGAITGAAMNALVEQMTAGAVLNTLALSSMLTFPSAVQQNLSEHRRFGPNGPPPSSAIFWQVVARTAISGTFWGQNSKSFFALITVGAEIEGIMTYATEIDSFVNQAYEPLTGHEFHAFHTFGAAIERGPGDSPLPMGGAITWGNVLLYKIQDVVGYNITDAVYTAITGNPVTRALQGDAEPSIITRAVDVAPAQNRSIVAVVMGMASHAEQVKIEPGTIAERQARLTEAKRTAGDIDREIVAVRERIAAVETALGLKRAELASARERLAREALSPEEIAEYERALAALQAKRDESYVQNKLAEIYDLKNPGDESERAAAMRDLENYYAGLLPQQSPDVGYLEGISAKMAIMTALSESVNLYRDGVRDQGPDLGRAVERVDDASAARIEEIVTRLEGLRGEAKAELTNRNALERLLAVINRSRNAALRDRRSGKEMLEFHENLAKLATVMDLALGLNEVAAAQAAIVQMQELVDAKRDKIRKVIEDAKRAEEEAKANEERNAEWEEEAEDKIKSDQQSVGDMEELEDQTLRAVQNITQLATSLQATLDILNAEDSGESANAVAEYNRRKALLPKLVEWSTNGKPGDEDFLDMKELQQHITDIDEYLVDINDGLSKIDGAPAEFAGVLIVAVPGVPEVNVNNPSQAQTLQILADRRAHWQAELDGYKETRDEFRNRLDPNFSGVETDDFGDVQPVSLPKRLAQAQSDVSRYSGEARSILQDVDRLAAEINAGVPGANLPPLAGQSLDQLTDSLSPYVDALGALSIPDTDTDAVFDAKMAKLKISALVPEAARRVVKWNVADATVEAVQEALVSPVPQGAALYERAVDLVQNVLDDVAADEAFIQNGGNGQALIDRKRALLVRAQPVLADAKAFIQTHAIPFQQDQIDSYDPNGDTFAKLFDSQIDLYEGVHEGLTETLPWALASNGAAKGDNAQAMANIQSQRERFTELLEGYDDEEGHHDGITELLDELARRKDPNNNETEEVYGQTLPFSLPKLITQFTAEKAQRAQQINSQHTDINDILSRIDNLSNNTYNLRGRFTLPTNINPTSQASDDAVQGLVDNDIYFDLGDLLVEIGNTHKDMAGDISLDSGEEGGVKVGEQPATTVDENTEIALLALEAAKRLVPSSNNSADLEQTGAAFAVARYLYSDGVTETAKKNLYERIPVAEEFLNQAKVGLQAALRDLDNDVTYVNSNGTSESGQAVVDRKIAIFGDLNVLTQAGVDFYSLKVTWSEEGLETVEDIDSFWEANRKIGENSITAAESELDALDTISESLQETFDDLEEQRKELQRWMSQLNDPRESALRRVGDSMSRLQEKTRAVLENNVRWHDIQKRFEMSNEAVSYSLRQIDEAQADLNREMRALKDPAGLPRGLAKRIQDLRLSGRGWAMPGETGDATAALVVPKKDFGGFLETLFGTFLEQNSSTRDLGPLRQSILSNPQSLSSIIPNSQVLDFGDADGFYLVYHTQFSVPNGLETKNQVTLGNVARLWGNNVSIIGYQVASPPNPQNAPWGDKGVEVQIESLQGENWVNYLNVDFHRFIQDIPPDTAFRSSAEQSRIMVFDDFAMLMFGGKLYIGLAGFADIATDKPGEKTQFYGGSFKTEFKFTEVMSLTAEQQRVVAKDPREFFQTINLDFTGLDPDLNRNFDIYARGENKDYTRTQVGPRFDIARLLQQEDAFTVDLFWSRVEGTDDINQDGIGATIIKGFTLRDSGGKPWMIINNRLSGEIGSEFNTLADRVSVTLPNSGIVVSAEGGLRGEAKTYYLEVAKKTGDGSNLSVGYGNRYVGEEPRLRISMNSSFSLGELWRAVAENTADQMAGSDALVAYNKDLDDFFGNAESDARVAEMRSVFLRDVGVKLLRQDVGQLTREIQELHKAGAFMDNTRIRGMVGFVTNPVGDDLSDRAVGGGFVAGTQTTLQLDETQRELIDAKVAHLYRASLQLQFHMMDLTRQWQESAVNIAQAQWDVKMAKYMAENAPTAALRAEGAVKQAEAEGRLEEATIRYNMLVGRNPDAAPPFDNLSSSELRAVLAEIQAIAAAPDTLVQALHRLDPEEIQAQVGDIPFNIMDWIPWVERLTLSFGAQFTDNLSNNILGVGATIRLPIYDPSSEERNHAYVLESEATLEEIRGVWEEYGMRSHEERVRAAWSYQEAQELNPRIATSAKALGDAIKGYRNGLISETRLREAFAQWHFYITQVMAAESRSALAAGWSRLDAQFAVDRPGSSDPLALTSLDEAFAASAQNSRSLSEIGYRGQAAALMAEAEAHRIQKLYLDVFIGSNLTADGVGWLPSIGVTGIPITPMLTFKLKPEELMELQVSENQALSSYYDGIKTKVEIDLAMELYRNIATWEHAWAQKEMLEREILPALEADLARAQAGVTGGDREGTVAAAQKALDDARRRLTLVGERSAQTAGTLNYLMGRPPGAPVRLSMTSSQAFAQLQTLLADKHPVENDRRILADRVKWARDVEVRIDKGLKIEELRTEPVSLVLRSLIRLAGALTEDGLANPELVAAARLQTLEAQRALEAYDTSRESRRAQTAAELRVAEAAYERLSGSRDPNERLEALEVSSRIRLLDAALARLGASPTARPTTEVPGSFTELERRLVAAEQTIAYAGREPEVTAFEPEVWRHKSTSGLRYYHARTSIGGDKIDKDYIDTWVEVRLRDPKTPREVLLALAELRISKAGRIHANDSAHAQSRGRILLTEFETNVRLLRWAQSAQTDPKSAAFASQFDAYAREIEARLSAQAERIKALLALPQSTSLTDLTRLVPADAAGVSDDITRVADGFIEQVESLRLAQIRETLFDGSLPTGFGNEDGLIHQLQADVIADRMSYNGFTPVVAFGIFRGVSVGGFFMEAPDPRSIQSGLERVLTESLRKELHSQGRMQELALSLHLLMSAVENDSKLVQEQQTRIAAAARDYQVAAAEHEAGRLSAVDLMSAQDALVEAWLDFSSGISKLKNDFIRLVTELEAIGYDPGEMLPPAARPLSSPAVVRAEDLRGRILAYGSQRFLDENYENQVLSLFSSLRLDEGRAEALQRTITAMREEGRVYRLMNRDTEAVRHKIGFTPAEKLELITAADVEGRRLRIQSALSQALRISESDPAARTRVLEFFNRDAKASAAALDDLQERETSTLRAMRQAYVESLDAPYVVKGALTRLETKFRAVEDARQELLNDYMLNLTGPAKFIMRDRKLDTYLKAQIAYDAEVAATFAMPEVKLDKRIASALDGLFPVRESLSRQQTLLRQGRGMLALDALIMLEESRLAGMRYDRAPRSKMSDVVLALSQLKEMRERWADRNPAELEPVYAVTEVDSEGRRSWSIEGWYTRSDLEELVRLGQVTKDGEGRLWLAQSDGSRQEIVGGVDAALADRDAVRDAEDANSERLQLHALFADHDFALVGLDGRVDGGKSYEEIFQLASQGRAFYFSRERGTADLRSARHPLSSLWEDPAGTVTIIYTGEEAYSRDRFPTYESLEDHLRRLRSSGHEDEAAKFVRLEAGPKGVEKMIRYARIFAERSQSRGWLGVKLQSYGFAIEDNGQPAAMYLTKGEFKDAVEALETAPRTLTKGIAAVTALRAELAQVTAESTEVQVRLDAEKLRFSLVEKEVRERLGAEVAQQLTRNEGETEDAFTARMRGEIDARTVQDSAYKAAQKIHGEILEEFNEKDDERRKLSRDLGEGFMDLRLSGTLVARSGDWADYGAAYLQALRDHGWSDARVREERDKLQSITPWRMFVTKDAAIEVDATQRLSGLTASPVYGNGALDLSFGTAEGAVQSLRGELFGAVVDHDGTLIQLYYSPGKLEREAKNFTLETVGGVRFADGGRVIDPNFRLSHYEKHYQIPDAEAPGGAKEVSLPVLLNRRYLIERLVDAGEEKTSAESWGVSPWNWVNILAEIPRGVLGTPVELLTGRDPNQHHFLGRVNMYKLEGGATQNHGFIRRAVGFVDILNLLPDPVEWYFDPSMFPESVQLNRGMRPGENIYDRNARTDEQNIHFGKGHAARTVIYNTEDLVNANHRVLSYFEGGVTNTWLETRRGRAGTYNTSSVLDTHGRDAINDVLEDPRVRYDINSDGRGDVSLGGIPGHIEVDRIERRVRVRPGADQYTAIGEKLAGAPELLATDLARAQERRSGLAADLARAEAGLNENIADRDRVLTEEEALWRRVHELSWRLGRQRALEAEIRRLESEIADLERQLTHLQRRLQDLLREREGVSTDPIDTDPIDTDPIDTDPIDTDPETGRPDAPGNWWQWAMLGALVAAFIAAILALLRGRRPGSSPPVAPPAVL